MQWDTWEIDVQLADGSVAEINALLESSNTMCSFKLTWIALEIKGRNRTVTPTPVQDNCTIYTYIYIQYIKISFSSPIKLQNLSRQ